MTRTLHIPAALVLLTLAACGSETAVDDRATAQQDIEIATGQLLDCTDNACAELGPEWEAASAVDGPEQQRIVLDALRQLAFGDPCPATSVVAGVAVDGDLVLVELDPLLKPLTAILASRTGDGGEAFDVEGHSYNAKKQRIGRVEGKAMAAGMEHDLLGTLHLERYTPQSLSTDPGRIHAVWTHTGQVSRVIGFTTECPGLR